MDGKNKLPNLPGQAYIILSIFKFTQTIFRHALKFEILVAPYLSEVDIQQIFTCSKPIMETPEQFVKHVQS